MPNVLPAAGPLVSWDHPPANDVADRCVPNHQDWAEAGPRLRDAPPAPGDT